MKIIEESLQKENTPAASLEPEPPKSEREKLRAMPLKDRIWYIGAYYKFHIIGALVAVLLIWTVATSLYRTSFDTALYCIYLNNRSGTELNTAPLEQGFSEYLGLGKKELISSESLYVSFGDDTSEFGYASLAKITALVASKDLDIMIGDRETIEHYASLGGLADLEAELPEETLQLVRDHLLLFPDDSQTTHAYGISLEGTWFAEESHLAQEPPILVIISNSTRKDTAAALLSYIFVPQDESSASSADR